MKSAVNSAIVLEGLSSLKRHHRVNVLGGHTASSFPGH